MKIAVIFDAETGAGGGYFQSLKSALLLKKLENNSINFSYITPHNQTFTKLKNEKLNTIFFKDILLTRIFYQLSQSYFCQIFLSLFKFKNPFVKFLKKNNFDFVIFLGPSWFIKVCDGYNFISSTYDINFKLDNYFPEYESSRLFESKNLIVKKSVNRAFKILVDTERSKKELMKLYNCPEKKIVVQAFTPSLPSAEKNIDKQKVISDLGLENKKFLFYPARFWSHKNHKYIIDAIKILDKKKYDINIVFCGSASDKDNLDYIKKKISDNGLNNYFFIYNFITDEEVTVLYKNCAALVMPTYVARSTLPLYEAFYFKTPVFYSKGVLDEKLEKLVTPIDLNDPQDLSDKISDLLSDKLETADKVNSALKYYNENCSEAVFLNNYKKIIDDYIYLSQRWKK